LGGAVTLRGIDFPILMTDRELKYCRLRAGPSQAKAPDVKAGARSPVAEETSRSNELNPCRAGYGSLWRGSPAWRVDLVA